MLKALSAVLIGLVRIYQAAISPLLGTNCRFQPTCSAYAIESIRVWGPFRGMWLVMKRIARCHPWGGHGWDPVPECPQHTLEENNKEHT